MIMDNALDDEWNEANDGLYLVGDGIGTSYFWLYIRLVKSRKRQHT